MPNKKQSARPAESGWLLEAGVIGIDKTLKLIKLSKWTLVELEILVRAFSLKPVLGETTDPKKKAGLPWFPIDGAHRTEFEPDLISYPIEGREDYQRCLELFFKCLVSEAESKRKLGRGPTSDRQPLYRWLMNADTLDLIVKGPEGVEVRSKRLRKIKAYCLVLADAVKVIGGESRTLPESNSRRIAFHHVTIKSERRDSLGRPLPSTQIDREMVRRVIRLVRRDHRVVYNAVDSQLWLTAR